MNVYSFLGNNNFYLGEHFFYYSANLHFEDSVFNLLETSFVFFNTQNSIYKPTNDFVGSILNIYLNKSVYVV